MQVRMSLLFHKGDGLCDGILGPSLFVHFDLSKRATKNVLLQINQVGICFKSTVKSLVVHYSYLVAAY